MADFSCSVVKTDEAKRVLQSDGLVTFAVTVDDVEYHQQISIVEYDTREKIEARMAEIGAQVAEEVSKNKPPSVPQDILDLVQ